MNHNEMDDEGMDNDVNNGTEKNFATVFIACKYS